MTTAYPLDIAAPSHKQNRDRKNATGKKKKPIEFDRVFFLPSDACDVNLELNPFFFFLVLPRHPTAGALGRQDRLLTRLLPSLACLLLH